MPLHETLYIPLSAPPPLEDEKMARKVRTEVFIYGT